MEDKHDPTVPSRDDYVPAQEVKIESAPPSTPGSRSTRSTSNPKAVPLYLVNARDLNRGKMGRFIWGAVKIAFWVIILISIFSRFSHQDMMQETPYAGDNQMEKIALIDISGVIDMEMPQRVRNKLQKAQKDDAVKGVILVVNSPGGSVVPSDMVHRYVSDFEKPVYACIEQLGASGGYWISVAADEIYAQTNSVVGSIGVIYVSFMIKDGLQSKLGVDPVVLKARKADFKDRGSMFRAMTDSERNEILDDLDTIHQRFVSVVSKGRELDEEAVWPLAKGDVYDGEEALENGLIDQIGFLDDAIAHMTESLDLNNPKVVRYTRVPSIEDFMRAGAHRLDKSIFTTEETLSELRRFSGVQALWQGY